MEQGMSDLQQALDILEETFGPIGNVKFLLSDGMELDAVSSDFLAIAKEARDGSIELMESYPEPNLRP